MDEEGRFSLFKKPITWIVLAVLFAIVGITGVGLYQYKRVQGELANLKNTTNGPLTDERQRELISEVSSKIMLPTDEKPTVAVVSDINRLKDQQFFTSGQNGDVVLIYMNAKKAVLYRPQEKKIIEVAPVNLNSSEAASVAGTQTTGINPPPPPTQTTPVPQPTVGPSTFALRNGTNITGLAKIFEQQLNERVANVTVIERGNAVKRTYEKTLLVDLSGEKAAQAQQIASSLGLDVGALPTEEPSPNADFLVIIGTDKR